MRFLASMLVALAIMSVGVHAADWIIAIAGSNSYYNYRHQSDLADFNNLLLQNGFPKDHLITFSYDDVASDPSNPFPGKLFNWQDDKGNLGPDVYAGMVKDYTKDQVTPENILKVLKGVPPGVGSNKVLKSTAEDNVLFVFFDHGGPGIIAVIDDVLNAADLQNAVTDLSNQKKFKNFLFLIEACESGSMFSTWKNIPKNVYALTASDPNSSSYACQYNNKLNTYLDDCWSIAWLSTLRANDKGNFTVDQLYSAAKQQTTESVACAYGDAQSIGPMQLADFIGISKKSSASSTRRPIHASVDKSKVSSRLVRLATIEQRLKSATTKEEHTHLAHEYNNEMRRFSRAEKVFESIRTALGQPNERLYVNSDDVCSGTTFDVDCMARATNAFKKHCTTRFDDYVLDKMYHLANFCTAPRSDDDFAHLTTVLATSCQGMF